MGQAQEHAEEKEWSLGEVRGWDTEVMGMARGIGKGYGGEGMAFVSSSLLLSLKRKPGRCGPRVDFVGGRIVRGRWKSCGRATA